MRNPSELCCCEPSSSCAWRPDGSIRSDPKRPRCCPNGSSTPSLQWLCFWGDLHLYFWSSAHLRRRTVSTRLPKNLGVEGLESREVLCQAAKPCTTPVQPAQHRCCRRSGCCEALPWPGCSGTPGHTGTEAPGCVLHQTCPEPPRPAFLLPPPQGTGILVSSLGSASGFPTSFCSWSCFVPSSPSSCFSLQPEANLQPGRQCHLRSETLHRARQGKSPQLCAMKRH